MNMNIDAARSDLNAFELNSIQGALPMSRGSQNVTDIFSQNRSNNLTPTPAMIKSLDSLLDKAALNDSGSEPVQPKISIPGVGDIPGGGVVEVGIKIEVIREIVNSLLDGINDGDWSKVTKAAEDLTKIGGIPDEIKDEVQNFAGFINKVVTDIEKIGESIQKGEYAGAASASAALVKDLGISLPGPLAAIDFGGLKDFADKVQKGANYVSKISDNVRAGVDALEATPPDNEKSAASFAAAVNESNGFGEFLAKEVNLPFLENFFKGNASITKNVSEIAAKIEKGEVTSAAKQSLGFAAELSAFNESLSSVFRKVAEIIDPSLVEKKAA